jgi:hypothetical protein
MIPKYEFPLQSYSVFSKVSTRNQRHSNSFGNPVYASTENSAQNEELKEEGFSHRK